MMVGLDGATRAAAAEQRPEPRLVRASHEFEAQMMKELLAPLTRTDAVLRGNEDEDGGILGAFAAESLAGALSAGGGLGIADRVVHALSRASVPTGKSEGSSAISAGK